MAFFKKIKMIFDVFFHILKVRKDYVLFCSFWGQYNDNPKYISEELHRQRPDINIFWLISPKRSKQNDIPDYVRVLRPDTLRFYFVKNQCKVIVDNGAGYYLSNDSRLKRFFKKHLKNRKQFDLSTWHGNPIKHIGAQIPGNEKWSRESLLTTSDCLISGSSFVADIFKSAFLDKIPIKLTGTPRNDILFSKNNDNLKKIKMKLGLPLDKKIVLFAPTYRNNPDDSGIIQLKNMDFDALFKSLSNRFGGDWCFVFRVHNMVLTKIDYYSLDAKCDGKLINGNEFDDMAEYLAVCDALISDYSGCIYDVALTKKPCFLYAHDRNQYENKERGLYFSLDTFPYSFSNSFDALIKEIETFDEEKCKSRRLEFLKKIGNVERGEASKEVVNIILNILGD